MQYKEKIIIHEVMHSVTKYKDDGDFYGSHNIQERESYMHSPPGNIFTKNDIKAIVNQDGNTNGEFKTYLIDNNIKLLQINREYSRVRLSSVNIKFTYNSFLLNAAPIEIGGGIINKNKIPCSPVNFKKNLLKNKFKLLDANLNDISTIINLLCYD